MQVIWPLLLGPNRGRYFPLTGQALTAPEALERGVVGEIVDRASLLDRAHELAMELAARNPVLLRKTRHALVRPLRRAMADDLHTGLALEALTSLAAADPAPTELHRVLRDHYDHGLSTVSDPELADQPD